MAIDTRYVAIVPKFDTRAFTNIKKKIEGIGKGLSEIKVGYKLNSRSLAGLKAALNSQIKNGNFLISIPVTYKKPSLSGLKSELKTSIADGKHSLKYPVTFSITGAKTKLLADLKGKKFSSIKVPVKFSLVGAKKELVSKLKASSFAAVKLPTVFSLKGAKKQLKLDIEALINKRIRIPVDIVVRDGSRGRGGSNNSSGGRGRGSFGNGALGDTLKYGAAAATVYGAGQMVASPFLIERDLLFNKAQGGEFKDINVETMKEAILEVSDKFPILAKSLSNVTLQMARANIDGKDIFGLKGKNEYDIANSLLLPTAALSTYANESPESVFEIFRQIRLFDPNIPIDRMANLTAGATDIATFNLKNMKQFFSRANFPSLKTGGLDLKTAFGLMALTNAMGLSPEQAGTSLKTFDSFTKNGRSKNATAAMEILDLKRFNEEGTGFENFRNILEDILTIKEKLKAGNGKALINGQNLTLQDFSKLERDILGEEGIKVSSALGIENARKLLIDMDKILESANLNEKIEIISQGSLYKLQILFSKVERAFVEAFDDDTLKAIGIIFEDIGRYVKEFAQYLKEINGLSGLWDNFMDSKFIFFLNKVTESLNNILKMVGVDWEADFNKIKKDANFVGPKQPEWAKQYSFSDKLGNAWDTVTNPFLSGDEVMSRLFASPPQRPISESPQITINASVPPNANPQEYAEAVSAEFSRAIALPQSSNRQDDIMSSGLGLLAP